MEYMLDTTPILCSSKGPFYPLFVHKMFCLFITKQYVIFSYIVASGIIEVLSTYLKSIRHEVAPGSNMSGFVEHGLTLLESMTSFVALR